MKILVLHGPNLNLLGLRDPSHYGLLSLEEINSRLFDLASKRGFSFEARQSNSEGELVSWLQDAAFGSEIARASCILFNPGAYAHTSLALSDAIKEVVSSSIPVIEVHLSNLFGREAIRQNLLTARHASGLISGFGPLSYELGFDAALKLAASTR